MSELKNNKFSVLQVAPYSNTGATHGGKIRVSQIHSAIAQCGADIEIVYLGDCDFQIKSRGLDLSSISPDLVGDIAMLDNDYGLKKRKFENLSAIIFEQPWAWNEVKKIKEANPNAKLIYSSHNIEYQLKERILRQYIGNQAIQISSFIRKLEIEIASSVDYVLAVSTEDAHWFGKFTKTKVIVAPNGTTTKINVDETSINDASNYVVVVGSAHPPNIEGCLKFLSDPELWMPRDSKIVVVGSLASALNQQWGHLRNRWSQKFVRLLTEINDVGLSNILTNSKAILLPIAYGGGTNLKTAEALSSGRPIIGSEQSFRGFEEYRDESGVYVVDNSLDFKIKTTSVLIRKKQNLIERNVSKLTWDYSLKEVKKLFSELLND